MSAPVLETRRLRLRGHVLSDMEPLCALLASDRSRFMDGPYSRREAWIMIAADAGSWDILGFGGWGIETREGTFLGQVAIGKPPHFPEVELGWMLVEGAEGHGYATEAAMAALDWAWSERGLPTLVSYVDPGNARSRALAERLGAVVDTQAARPEGETATQTVVYRHSPDADGSPEAYA